MFTRCTRRVLQVQPSRPIWSLDHLRPTLAHTRLRRAHVEANEFPSEAGFSQFRTYSISNESDLAHLRPTLTHLRLGFTHWGLVLTHLALFLAHAELTQAHYSLGWTHTKSSQVSYNVSNHLWCIQLNHRSFSSKILIFWIWHEKASKGNKNQSMGYSHKLQLWHAVRVGKTLRLCTSWAKLAQWFGIYATSKIAIFRLYPVFCVFFWKKYSALKKTNCTNQLTMNQT